MTKKKSAASKGETKATVQVSPTVKAADEVTAVTNAELVNEAGINITVEPGTETKEEDTRCQPATKEELEKLPSEMRGEAPETVHPESEKRATNQAPAQNFQPATDYTVILNTSLNPILLQGQHEGETLLIAPKEIKAVSRALLRELLKSKVVRYWFDKGILTTNQDANETSANEAEAPAHLSQPVERHDGANVSASVTKFEKQGSVTINL